MGAKLVKNIYNRPLMMKDLQCGQIAVITSDRYRGEIVQRYKDYGVNIGKPGGNSWSDIDRNTLEVRVLKAGELIEII